jgi:uncharacterized protein YtpQ (UPF0354 family)
MGLEREEAMTLGRSQALAALPPLIDPNDLNEGVFKLPKTDYLASLILADGWDELDEASDGNLMVGVPSDDVILIANLAFEEKRALFQLLIKQEYQDANRSVSELTYVRRNNEWTALRSAQ